MTTNPPNDDKQGTVIPATPGQFAVVLTLPRTTNRRPTAEDIQREQLPIVAWRISREEGCDIVQPLVPGSRLPTEVVLLELPEKRFANGVVIYEDIIAAEAAMLERAQQLWDSLDKPLSFYLNNPSW